MSRRKQRSVFDQVSEFDRERIVAYRDCGLSLRKIGSRVGRNKTPPMRICHRRMQEGRRTGLVDRINLSAQINSGICLQHHDGRIRVWRHRGERMLNIMHRHPGPAPGIMVWGGIGYHSRTPLVHIAGTLKIQRYINEVLEPVILPYLQRLATSIFQQDNARPHVTRIVLRQSPD
ncbi:transposable element Tcb1 transposase [Trichonephila clavipes]|nr:transposable element Tcb1 transposase [Trichonephila clavipes]